MTSIRRGGRLVTTAGVAERDGAYFLARRKVGGAQSGRWEFPGGKCDRSDGVEARCLKREFQEEFEVDIDVHEELGAVPFDHGAVRYLLVAFRITFLTEPTTLLEHTDSGWFTPVELRALDLADSDRTLVETVLLR
ncbi:MAG: NUDIX domain-containing protein [Spirochaetales bacterium]|nr:NUDIX domain-containing protein [Spirochaetales bacterium]